MFREVAVKNGKKIKNGKKAETEKKQAKAARADTMPLLQREKKDWLQRYRDAQPAFDKPRQDIFP